MKKLLYLLPLLGLLISPLQAVALTGDNTRFDWFSDEAAVTADNTNTCNNQAVARFDWLNGEAAVVYDTTATCALTVTVIFGPPKVLIKASTFIKSPFFIH